MGNRGTARVLTCSGYRYHEDIRYYRRISPKLGRAFVQEVEATVAHLIFWQE